ncbi:unnamed protein product [Angiostrongylus costaricensis]|uniref:FLCN protein n=1 Tax=Angiostrongylus costaricensis TaxID=334426 RepID=A0A0R3Q051_ANGCS|nr:unnamed protein product [Angiostrongylus costaricensis]
MKFFFHLDEVITLSDSPLEHINATPFSVFGSQHSPGGNVSKWAPLLRRSTTSDPSPPSKSVPTPLRHISPASEAELEKAGFDPHEGSTIRYPANEHCRQYEMDIVKLCTAENSAVCLPLAISADHICAVVVMNFLRWFPRSRAIFCCSSLEAAHLFEERCKAIGIPLEEKYQILFRVILVTPSVPSTSRKLKPLRNRQQIITSLIISQWIEPSALDPSFRSSAVPLEISVDYYSTTDGTSELVSFTEKWIEADAPFEISFNNQSFTSHPKFSRLRSVLEKCSFPVRCLILCENGHLSRVVCESLHTPQLRDAIIRVLPDIARKLQNESIILVVDIDIPNFVNVVDTICSSRLQVVVSMDRRYNFSYEFSRLQLPSSKMELVQYIPVTLCSVLDMKVVS